jgi:hypothetical protein
MNMKFEYDKTSNQFGKDGYEDAPAEVDKTLALAEKQGNFITLDEALRGSVEKQFLAKKA